MMVPSVAGAVTCKMKERSSPEAILPPTSSQVSSAPAVFNGVQVAPMAPVADMPGGNWSSTTTGLPVGVAPPFLTTSV